MLILPNYIKLFLVLSLDILLAIFSVWLSYYLRLGEFLSLFNYHHEHFPQNAVFGSIIILLPTFLISGLYKTVFRFSSWPEILNVGKGIVIYGIVFSLIFTVYRIDGVPRTIGIIQPLLLFFFISLSRFSIGILFHNLFVNVSSIRGLKKVLIYGSNENAIQLHSALLRSDHVNVVGFISDDQNLIGRKISNLLIFDAKSLNDVVRNFEISEILLALSDVGRRKRNIILSNLQKIKVKVRTLPNYSDVIRKNLTFNEIKDLSVYDLLGREPVTPEKNKMKIDITNKIVLVTGAGGSIGKELCRQIINLDPKTLILFEQNEYSLYSILKELISTSKNKNIQFYPILGSICDQITVNRVFKQYLPNTIYHAAAYKHVPLVEINPFEGIYNNVFGTMICAKAAIKNKVLKFVLISTDKAVRPTNVMGASKRLSEMILQGIQAQSVNTSFSIVRFGNVLDSSGSVVPLFREQINNGGPLTVTHRRVTRYFMTISEASQLVIYAGSITPNKIKTNNSAPIFLLDMGEPVKIYNLAKKMIELSGLSILNNKNPNGDIEIKFIGLRPGEKLIEELLISGKLKNTENKKIKIAVEKYLPWEKLESYMLEYEKCIKNNNFKILISLLKKSVSGYKKSNL